jgi:drug/metabolite transporter (DMT)-like permease
VGRRHRRAGRVNGRDTAELALLGALWGASFLFMRLGAVEFGPVALVFVRVAGAALLLLPLLLGQGQGAALRRHWRPIAVVGLVNSALPFLLYMVAALVLGAGLMAVFNATAPIWGALIAALWLGERLGPGRALGLAIGVAGVVTLVWGKADLRPGVHGISPALGMAACLGATLLYGLAANYSRKRLAGVPPLAVAAGSQLAAALLLVLPAWWAWPPAPLSATAWGAAAALAVACTGLAYVLYFRLIANVGAANAISVTFLVPGFAMLWGWLLLGEQPTPAMLLGCAVILLGTALSTGMLKLPPRPRAVP